MPFNLISNTYWSERRPPNERNPPMRIAICSERVERTIAERYARTSLSLTKTTCVRSQHNVRSWQSSLRSSRRSGRTLNYTSIRCRQELACKSPEVLPSRSFSAVFDLGDGQRCHPDKDWIKSPLDHGLNSGRTFNDELIFAVPESSRLAFERNQM